MKIDPATCIGCEACRPYCPMGAIRMVAQSGESISRIDQTDCVECGVCLRCGICPTDAIFMPDLSWPRSIRAAFSNPLVPHKNTQIGGRGTEEMKTNDVTGRFKKGMAGVAVEMGRPGVGTTFRDVQTVAGALAGLGVRFEPENPVAAIMINEKTGEITPEVLDEKVLSAIIEFIVPEDDLTAVLNTLKAVSARIETVFSATLIGIRGDHARFAEIAADSGFAPRPNTKTNLGLGRPLREV